MAKAKVKADCRADTRGEGFAGIPTTLIKSAAYRDLSVHARAVLVELTARMNGYNNGSIAVSQRELVEALGCHNRRAIAAVAELMDHGLIDVTADGLWKQRQARLYRLTFVSTKTAAASNEYLRWTPQLPKSRDATLASERVQSGATMASGRKIVGATVASKIAASRIEAPRSADATLAPLIFKPCPPAQPRQRKGDNGSSVSPLNSTGDHSASAMDRSCERCGGPVILARPDRAFAKRFCSDRCRKQAEAARAYRRKVHGDDAVTLAQALPPNVHRLIAGGRA